MAAIALPFFVRSGVNKIGTKPNDPNDYRKARPDQQPYTRLACVEQQKHSSKNADDRQRRSGQEISSTPNSAD
jgi:hypothetical protein